MPQLTCQKQGLIRLSIVEVNNPSIGIRYSYGFLIAFSLTMLGYPRLLLSLHLHLCQSVCGQPELFPFP